MKKNEKTLDLTTTMNIESVYDDAEHNIDKVKNQKPKVIWFKRYAHYREIPAAPGMLGNNRFQLNILGELL